MSQLSPDPQRLYWDRLANRYDRSVRLLGGATARMALRASAAVAGRARVLEVGAGTGLVTRALANSAQRVVATDYSQAMVAMLQRRVEREDLGNVECVQMDLYAIPDELGSFDVVVAANLLHLVPDLPGALLALRRPLKPNGLLIAPTYCHAETRPARALSRLLAWAGLPSQRRFTTASLVQAIEAAGYSVQRSETLPGLLPIGYVEAQWCGPASSALG